MAIDTKNRSELKAYFVKNAIPTESNFSDLIDGQLNQADDGVFKLGDDPLSVVAAPGDQKRVLRLYEQYPAQTPSWTVSLMPRTNVSDKSTAARGLGFDAPDGTNRLFLNANGKLGLGTTKPSDKLTVQGGDVSIQGGNYRRLKVVSDTYWAGIELVARQTDGKEGNPHIDFTHGDLDKPNFGIRVWSPDNSKLVIDGGSLGVGRKPESTLDVQGHGRIRGQLLIDQGVQLSSQRGGHNETDGAYYRKGNQVWMTLSDWLLLRKPNSSDGWGVALESGGLIRSKGGIQFSENNRSGHLDTDGSLYRLDNNIWFTADNSVHFRDKGVGSGWGVRVTTGAGEVSAKGGYIIGHGDRSSHLNVDGAFYRKAGQAWLVVDDHLYIRDSGQANDDKKFHFNTGNGNLSATGGLYAKTEVGIGSWRIVESGNHLLFKRGSKTVARFSIDHDRFQVYRNINGESPYFYYNSNGKRP